VSQNGDVLGKAAGSATITVTTVDGNKTASCTVTVGTLSVLSGTITITPTSSVATGAELTATYSGSETVTYQWKKDGGNVGTNANKYKPTEAGSYTVTVSATGYAPKTSAVVDVGDSTLSALPGTITISPSSGVNTGTDLTATYSGTQTVTYQWRRDGENVGTTNIYKATQAGSYTVTVGAAGYNSKTSTPIAVTAPSTQTMAVIIIGTPEVGNVLTADVQKNFTGKNEYQWYLGSEKIDGYNYFEFPVGFEHVGKAISVEVTCGGKTARSPTVTARDGAYTLALEYNDWNAKNLYAYITFGQGWRSNANNWPLQWYRNNAAISGATTSPYTITPADAGKVITCKVTVKCRNQSGRTDEAVLVIAGEIEEAYNDNLGGCKTAIDNTGITWWEITFWNLNSMHHATIANEERIFIHFSLEKYDTFPSDRTTRLNEIGEELKSLIDSAKSI
jgi:hypothetical protein